MGWLLRTLMAALTVVILIACGGADPTPPPTPSPTPTPQPAATSTSVPPAATATPEPAAAADMQLGALHLRQQDATSPLFISGEIYNHGEMDVQEVLLRIHLYDASGTIAHSQRPDAILDIVPAGSMSPFASTVFDVDLADIVDTQVEIEFSPYDPDSFHGFTYALHVEVTDLEWESNRISGTLANTGDMALRHVYLIVAGYDTAGQLVGVEHIYADDDEIAPAASSTFSRLVPTYDEPPVRWTTVAQGSRVR
jgi:hypothetical protein